MAVLSIKGLLEKPLAGEGKAAHPGRYDLTILLMVLWAVANLVLGIASALIHLLLIIAATVNIYVSVRAVARRT